MVKDGSEVSSGLWRKKQRNEANCRPLQLTDCGSSASDRGSATHIEFSGTQERNGDLSI